MALNVLAPLLAAGFAGHSLMDYFQSRDRGLLQAGINEALGSAPGIFDPSSSDPMMMGGQVDPGSGLLADPTNINNQLQFARDIIGLPGSGEALGGNLLRDIMGFGEAEQAQQAEFGDRARRQQNEFGQRNREQQNVFQHQRDLQQARLDAAAEAAANQPVDPWGNMGSIATGYQRVPVKGGGWADIPNLAHPDRHTASDELRKFEAAAWALDDVMTMFQENAGTPFTGADRARMETSFIAALMGMKDVFGLGALQGPDEEIIKRFIADPTNWDTRTSFDDTTIARWDQAMKIIQRNLKHLNQKYQYWGMGSELAEATPAQIRELQERAAAAAAAEQQGLTILPGETPPAASGGGLPNYVERLPAGREDALNFPAQPGLDPLTLELFRGAFGMDQ